MRVFFSIQLISLLIFSLVSCGPGNTVKVDSFTPTGEVQSVTNFAIEFSEDLAPSDMQNKWLDEKFVTFSPAIPGKFKWTSASTLVFSPDAPLEPIQSYSAKINNSVLFNTKFSPDFEEYNFHTPFFDVTKVDFFWTDIPYQNYKLSVQANIHFNYPVDPKSLRNYLEVKRAGAELNDFQIVSDQSSDVIAINFGEVQQTDKEQLFSVKVKQNLISTIGKDGLKEARTFEAKLPPITRLAITNVTAGFDGSTGWIEVATTQTVDDKRLKDFITTKPERKLNFSVSGNVIRIETDLGNVQTVELKIKKGLPGLYGGELEYDYEQEVSMVNVEPSINFADKKGKYLMLGGEENLKVNAVNINEIEIEVSKVFKNNLVHFLNQYGYYYYNDEYEYEYYNPGYYVGDFGETLYQEKIKLPQGQNWLKSFTVNMNKALGQKYKGIYTISVRSADERWRSDSKMVAISDLGIISKIAQDEIYVFVNSIGTTQPVADADINIISTNNQTILSGKSDKDGVVIFKDVKKKTEGFEPRLVVAEKGDDFNYIDLRETKIETSRFDVGGITQYAADFNVFLYSPRNIYRPGEEIQLSAIVRNDKINIVKNIPLITKIITPAGKVFDEYKKDLNDQGSFEISFKIPEYAQTGNYSADVYTGSKQLVGSYKFQVEEFVPDKIRVNVKSDKAKTKPGDKVTFDISAEFLFGAPAAGVKYETDIQLNHKSFVSKNYPGYVFSNSSVANTTIEHSMVEGQLDSEGKSKFTYNIPSEIQSKGVVTGTAYVSVFDLTGRTVTRSANFDVYPKDYFIGIKSTDYYYGVNQNINFYLVAVDEDDKQINNFDALAKLVRYEWQTVLKKDYNNRYYYASEEKEINEWEKNVTISGATKFNFIVSKSGKYELRIYKKGSNDYERNTFYAYGWGTSTAESFQVDKEGRIEIVFDKEQYEPGEKAKVLFTCPFSGKMLVTLERGNVYSWRYIDVNSKSAEIELSVDDDLMPNAYVTATLFRKHSKDDSAPFLVGHGFASMNVIKNRNKLPVSISAPQKIKPNTTQQITIKTEAKKDIYVTLAAVDEGILQITDFSTPDPFGVMYAKRPLMVESYDLYKLLLPEIVKISSSTGGGEMEQQLQKRTNPISVTRFKLLSYWSGIKKTNSDGSISLSLNIPQFNGEVRLMAVAYTGSRFGSADFHMKVADDLIIEPQVPRFLAVNDSLIAPVSIVNTTDKEANVEVTLKVEGPLKITTSSKKSLKLKSNSTGTVSFGIFSQQQVGAGKIIFETSGLAKVKEEIDIAVRPTSPYLTETGSGTIEAGKEIKIDLPKNFLSGTQKTTLTISKFPAVKFAKQLKYLVGYPYGCIEQTVSKLFPQLYFEDLAKLVAPELYRTNNPVYYVKEGIRKIESMQLYDGSIAYWQGGVETNWWGSVYAAHFLVEAKKAGYNVSENVLNKLLKYISSKAKEQSTYDYVTYTSTGRTIKKIANKEILYSLYVLALAGEGDVATMNYYKARPHLVSEDMTYMLAGSYALMGRWNSYYEIVPNAFEPVRTDRLTGGCFDSDIRANAIILNVLIDVEPANKQIPLIIKYLTQNSDRMYSTQERSFAFLGLGKAASLKANTDVNVDILSDGKSINKFSGNDLSITDEKLNSANLTLKATGKGEVYYFWSVEGVKLNDKVKEEDSYMQVRRSFYSYKTGRLIPDFRFYQGELVVCKIELTGFERNAENVVITDLIPAGFEIENPRLNPATELKWIPKNPLIVQYMDIRDDRLLLFTNLNRNNTNDFYYLLRVVNQGTYQLPVIGAEAMYDQEYHSYNGARVVKVLQRLGE